MEAFVRCGEVLEALVCFLKGLGVLICCAELCWGSRLLQGGVLGLSSAAGNCVGALTCCGELFGALVCCGVLCWGSRVLREAFWALVCCRELCWGSHLLRGAFWGSRLLRGVVLGLSCAAGSFLGSRLLRGIVLGLSSAAGSFGAPGSAMNPGNEMHLQPFSLASRKTRFEGGADFRNASAAQNGSFPA